jgi:hypothetical protein
LELRGEEEGAGTAAVEDGKAGGAFYRLGGREAGGGDMIVRWLGGVFMVPVTGGEVNREGKRWGRRFGEGRRHLGDAVP